MKERKHFSVNFKPRPPQIPPPTVALPTIVTTPPPWLSSGSSVPKSHFLYTPPSPPKVFYTDIAWSKLQLAIQVCAAEVGWLGLVDRTPGGNFLITDLFVLKQKVTGASTEIDGDDLNRLDQELFERGIDPSKLKYWGHSHVNMGVTPSGQDESMAQTYIEDINDGEFFIRGIYNKRGDSKVDVYIKHSEDIGWIHECVEDSREAPIFDGATDFCEAIKRDVEVKIVAPTFKKGAKRNQSNLEEWGSPKSGRYWDDDGFEYGLPYASTGDLGMVSEDAEQALLADLDASSTDVNDPFFATGK